MTNRAGHRLPSGVGFRRAWIEFAVLDAEGGVLWGSGLTDTNGVMVGPGDVPLPSEFTGDWRALQPHWQEITRPGQVQVYEERHINRFRDGADPVPEIRLTTSFLGIGKVVKDNRLLPRGYHYADLHEAWSKAPEHSADKEMFDSLLPTSSLPEAPGAVDPRADRDYTQGTGMDEVTYRIPLDEIGGATQVRVRLLYQSLPPYYLRDVFSNGKGPQTQRLYHLVGHLRTIDTPIGNWKIEIAEDSARIPG